MREGLAELAVRQHGAFTGRQAAHWYRPGEIRHRLRTGRWHRLCRGVFCDGSRADDVRTRLVAVRLAFCMPVVACLYTAAELHGFGVIRSPQVHVVDPGERHLHSNAWLAVHQLDVLPADVVAVDGFATTAPARTAVELARLQGRPLALAVLDGALRSGAVTAGELTAESERHAKRRGIVHVRKLLPLADPKEIGRAHV